MLTLTLCAGAHLFLPHALSHMLLTVHIHLITSNAPRSWPHTHKRQCPHAQAPPDVCTHCTCVLLTSLANIHVTCSSGGTAKGTLQCSVMASSSWTHTS